MKIKLLLLFFLLTAIRFASAQLPQEVFTKPLKEVLSDIGKRYKVKLEYTESSVEGLNITYPTWRYRVDIEQTLTNILFPVDFVFQKKGNNGYTINKYEYWHKTPEEGQQHLDQLLASYPSLAFWESRKNELFLNQ